MEMQNGPSESLDCPICRDLLIDPRPLPCGHSFCGPPRECLNSCENANGGMTCAICRDSRDISPNEIRPLYGIRDYLELQFEAPICPHHRLPSKLWCTGCEVMICEFCVGFNHDGHAIRLLHKHYADKVLIKEEQFGEDLDVYRDRIEGFVRKCNEKLRQLETQMRYYSDKITELEMSKSIALEKKGVVEKYEQFVKQGTSYGSPSVRRKRCEAMIKFIDLDPALPTDIFEQLGLNDDIISGTNLFTVEQREMNFSLYFKEDSVLEVSHQPPEDGDEMMSQFISVGGYKISIACTLTAVPSDDKDGELILKLTRNCHPSIFLDLNCVLRVSIECSRVHDHEKCVSLRPQIWSLKHQHEFFIKVGWFTPEQIRNLFQTWLTPPECLKMQLSFLTFLL